MRPVWEKLSPQPDVTLWHWSVSAPLGGSCQFTLVQLVLHFADNCKNEHLVVWLCSGEQGHSWATSIGNPNKAIKVSAPLTEDPSETSETLHLRSYDVPNQVNPNELSAAGNWETTHACGLLGAAGLQFYVPHSCQTRLPALSNLA